MPLPKATLNALSPLACVKSSFEEAGVHGEEFFFTHPRTGDLPVKFSCFCIEPGATTIVDEHAVVELWYIVSGTGTVTVDDAIHPVAPGSVCFFSSFEKHGASANSSDKLMIISCWWNHGL